MPLSGEASNKLGTVYEGHWTVRYLADVLDGKFDSIRLAPPGWAGEGIEFSLEKGDLTEYHQVKRQHGRTGSWTVADLIREGVLSHFQHKLQDANTRCVFVSANAADELDELVDRVWRSKSRVEFETVWLTTETRLGPAFDRLCNIWIPWSKDQVYETLKLGRLKTRTIDPHTLREIVETRLAPLIEGDPATITDVLAEFVLARVNHDVTAHDIWRHLESRGVRTRDWGRSSQVLASVDALNDRYLSALHRDAICGKEIPREETQKALEIFGKWTGHNSVMLEGGAGTGKSCVIAQIVRQLRSEGWPVMIFRVDRREPTDSADKLGEQLGLPGSPANVLAAIAQGSDCLMVIDQLDAVSSASGRHSGFFDCINDVINQARIHDRMHLLLGCRKFDIENDHRLRKLVGEQGAAETVTLGTLAASVINDVVNELGADASRLTKQQRDLLAVPLHLKLFSEVARQPEHDALGFTTINDLYDSFWEHKQTMARERLGRSVNWNAVVDRLCEYMSDHESLYAPKDVTDDYRDDAVAMASAHALTQDGSNYAFFHEGFFDYAFARRFAASGRDLLEFLLGSEQHLFRRAQIRQILLYERRRDFDRYLRHLHTLLHDSNIRFHLKKVAFALLAELFDPAQREWQILALFLEKNEDGRTREVWQMLKRSAPWFQLLDSLGFIKSWLEASDENRVDRAAMLLPNIQRVIPERVAELLIPFVGATAPWPTRLTNLIQWSDLTIGREFFELFLRLINEAYFDKAEEKLAFNGDFWTLLYSLSSARPDWCSEAVGCYLRRHILLSENAEEPNPFANGGSISHRGGDYQMFESCARGAPEAFVEHVLPCVIAIVGRMADRDGAPPWKDPVWSYRSLDPGLSLTEALLSALDKALSEVARNSPSEFLDIAKELRASPFETIQFLLIRSYTVSGAAFSDEAADYLCESSGRLKSGYGWNGDHWATRQLLEAITPHCTDSRLRRLEAHVLNYYPQWEKHAGTRGYRGKAQFILLEGITSERRSPVADRRLNEWRRKFGRQSPEPPSFPEVHDVPPPIPSSAIAKMTDSQWLRALAKYHKNDHYRRDGTWTGGAVDLSRQMEAQAKRQPKRFVELCFRLPASTPYFYFAGILRGITGSELDANDIVRVCQMCHKLPSRPCGDEICGAIAKLSIPRLPAEAIQLLEWYAIEDPSPIKEHWKERQPNKRDGHARDILSDGINSVRGKAAEAIAERLFADNSTAPDLLFVVEKMVRDPSVAVRSCVATSLLALLNYDRDIAVRLFQQLCNAEDALFEAPDVDRFIWYAVPSHYQALASIIDRMRMSELPMVARAGGRHACLAGLVIDEAQPLANLCDSGNSENRLGAAEVYSANVRTLRFKEFCEKRLTKMFYDTSAEVREKAASCFGKFENNQLGDFIALVESFVDSPAFSDGHEFLIRALEATTAKLPDIVCVIAERFIEAVGQESGDLRTRLPFEAEKIGQLLLRAYSQAIEPNLKRNCLNAIDRMLEVGAYGVDKALTTFDR